MVRSTSAIEMAVSALSWMGMTTPTLTRQTTISTVAAIANTIAATCLLLITTACTPPHPTHPPLPTIDAVRPPVTSSPAGSGHPQSQLAAALRVVRLTLPLDADTEAAWALTDPTPLNPTATEAWRDNGIHVALLKHDQLDRFLVELPGLNSNPPTQWITLNAEPTPLPVSPVITRRTTLTITHPASQTETIQLTSGRLRLIAELIAISSKEAVVEWTPQAHEPRVTVQPRQPQEKALDGRVIDSLALRTPLPPDHWVVMGLFTPAAAPPTPAATVQPPTTQPVMQPTTTDPAMPPDSPPTTQPTLPKPAPSLPDHLGKHMFTATRFGRPVQTILMIAVTRTRN
jgi:hypothetical protein